jgi:hypothetical protein
MLLLLKICTAASVGKTTRAGRVDLGATASEYHSVQLGQVGRQTIGDFANSVVAQQQTAETLQLQSDTIAPPRQHGGHPKKRAPNGGHGAREIRKWKHQRKVV